MKEGTIYLKDSGRILMTVVAPDEAGVLLQISDDSIQGAVMDVLASSADAYVVGGKIVERPVMNLSLSGDVYLSPNEQVRIENIPVGATVVYPGGQTRVDDGYVEWASTEPGSYKLSVELFPMKEVTVNAIVG